MKVLVGILVRHSLGALGASGVVISDDQITQIAGAVTTLAMIAWSIWEKRQRIADE